MKMWYIYTAGYYSAVQKNKIMKLISKWMQLEAIITSEVIHFQKGKCHMLFLICGS